MTPEETFEESAENEWKKYKYSDILYVKTFKDGFVAGINWRKNKSFTNDEVIEILQKRLLSIGIYSSITATEIWFNQYKK